VRDPKGESQMKLTGTCTLVVSGRSERAMIEFDISAQTITIWRTSPADLKDFFTEGEGIWSKRVSVRDIEVFSPTALLCCDRLPPAFPSSYRPPRLSVDDGEISKIMAIGEGQVHAMRLDLALHRRKLALRVEPFADSVELQHESVFTNHSRYWNQRFSVDIGRRSFDVRYSPRHVFLTGRLRAKDAQVFRHACSLIALGPERLIAQLKPPTVTLNYSWGTAKAYGEVVISEKDLPSSFQLVLNYLTKCDEKTRRKRFYEITHIVEGFQQKIFVEHRLTNLLKALESFDGTKTLSANRLAGLLGTKKGDARFLCGIRNCLVHKGMSLAEAAQETHGDLSTQNVKMERFAHLPQTPKLSWRLYVTFSRLIVSAYFRQIGISRTNTLYPRNRGF